MELAVEAPAKEWSGEVARLSPEEDVVFTEDGCRLIDGRQVEFYLV